MATRTEWQGRVGKSWAQNADHQDEKMAPQGDEAMAELAAMADGLVGLRVLDLGCGAGATSFQLADLVGHDGEVIGLDVSPPLIERARERHAGRDAARLRFMLEDATCWQAETPMDALYSRCGAMFFDDPLAAFANLRAQMRPGAPLAIACWGERERCLWGSLPPKLLEGLLDFPPSTPPGGPGPFGWSVIEPALAMLAGAGWRGAQARRFAHETPLSLGDDPDPLERAVLSTFRIGTAAGLLAQASEPVRAEARARLREGFAPYVRDGAVMLPASSWIVTARA